MPQAADMIINNGAATPVAKTFSLVSPAAGDKSSAIWWLREGANVSIFPSVELSARKNADGTARKAMGTLKMPNPIIDTTLNQVRPGSSFAFGFWATVPNDFPETMKNDAVAYAKNIVANAIINACLKDGVSAT